MGNLARRTEGGTRLVPAKNATLQELLKEREIDKDEVVYEVTDTGTKEMKLNDMLQPGKTYGVVPHDDRG